MITANGKVIETCGQCGKPVTRNKVIFGGVHLCKPDPPTLLGWCDDYLLLRGRSGYSVTTDRGHLVYANESKAKAEAKLLKRARKDARRRKEPKDQRKAKAIRWLTPEDIALIERIKERGL